MIPLTLDHRDSNGVSGNAFVQYIGRIFMHTGNKKDYEVQALVYDGAADLWALQYKEVNEPEAVSCVRNHVNFFGKRAGILRMMLK